MRPYGGFTLKLHMENNWWVVCSPSPSSRKRNQDGDGEYTARIALMTPNWIHTIYNESITRLYD